MALIHGLPPLDRRTIGPRRVIRNNAAYTTLENTIYDEVEAWRDRGISLHSPQGNGNGADDYDRQLTQKNKCSNAVT